MARSLFRDTIMLRGPGGLFPLAGAEVRFYEPNGSGPPTTPIGYPLYPDAHSTVALPSPYVTGPLGELEVWADLPHRVRIIVGHAAYAQADETIDLEYPPEAMASLEDVTDAIADHEAEANPHPPYLTPSEADLAYVNVDGDRMTGDLELKYEANPSLLIRGTTAGGEIQFANNTAWISTWHLPVRHISISPNLFVDAGIWAANKKVAVSATAGNTLTWNSDGFYSAGGLTEGAADLRYLQLTGGVLSGVLNLNTAGAPAVQLKRTTNTQYKAILGESYLAFGGGSAGTDVFLQRTAAGVVNVTGHWNPALSNLYDLGTAGQAWRKLYAFDADFVNPPTVGGVPIGGGGISQADADLRYVNSSGDVMSGALTVSPYVIAPLYIVSGPAGTNRILSFGQFGVANRWYLYATADAETGSSAGSDLAIDRFSDAGVATRALTLSRATGEATFSSAMTVQNSLTTHGSIVSYGSNIFAIGATTGAVFIAQAQAGAEVGLKIAGTNGDRWRMTTDAVAETGSNAGSNFHITRWSDDGATYLGAVLTLSRATGTATFGGTVSVPKFVVGGGGGTGNDIQLVDRVSGPGWGLWSSGGTFHVWDHTYGDRLTIDPAGDAHFLGGAVTLDHPSVARITATNNPLRLNGNGQPIIFENTGGEVGRFNGSDYWFEAKYGIRVATNPLVIDPTPGNGLTWTASGLYATGGTGGGGGLDIPTADARYVNLAGDTMTGQLNVEGNVAATMGLFGGALYIRQPIGTEIYGPVWERSGFWRWFAAVAGAETGSNTGSDWSLNRTDDAGGFLGVALSISRATGAATFGGDVVVASPTSSSVSLQGAGNAFLSMYGPLNGLTGVHLGSWPPQNRWRVALHPSSDLHFGRHDDAGAYNTTPVLALSRATGAATFGGDVAVNSALATDGTVRIDGYRGVLHFNNSGEAVITSNAGIPLKIRSGSGGAADLYLASGSTYVNPEGHLSNSLGSPSMRWNMVYAGGAEFTAPPTISSQSMDDRYVNTAGDTMTGALSVANYLISPALFLDQPPGTDINGPVYRRNGNWRFATVISGAETGSNAGSDFSLRRYSDASGDLGTVLSLSRATGAATFGGAVTAQGIAQVDALRLRDPQPGGANTYEWRYTSGADTLALRFGTLGGAFSDTGFSVTYGGGVTSTTSHATVQAHVAGKPVAVSPDASNALEWRANGFWSGGGAGGAFVDETGDTMSGALILQGATSTTNVLQAKLAADTVPRFQFDASGKLEWGPGGASASDVSITRNSSSAFVVNASWLPSTTGTRDLGSNSPRWRKVYATDTDLSGFLAVGGTVAAAGSVRMANATTINWRNAGNTADLTLGVDASNRLLFNGEATFGGDLWLSYAAPQINLKQAADTLPRAQFLANGVNWGPGGATPPDSLIIRSGANDVRTNSSFSPTTTNARDLGTSALRWRKLWVTDVDVTNSPVVSSHASVKEDFAPLDPAACADAVAETDWLAFRYRASPLAQKGYALGHDQYKVHNLFGLEDRRTRSDGADLAVVAAALQNALARIAQLEAQIGAA